MSLQQVVLLLGSNLGDEKKNIEDAILLISNNIGKITQKTEILITKPVEFVSSNNFCNIALVIDTVFSPISLLNKLKEMERQMGRKVDSKTLGGYTDRIIDIDIIYYNALKFVSKNLEIPHKKHVFERDFSKKLLSKLDLKT